MSWLRKKIAYIFKVFFNIWFSKVHYIGKNNFKRVKPYGTIFFSTSKLNGCWIWWMNFHISLSNVLWKHLEKFEMNLMNMKYPKTHSNVCNIYFCCLMNFLKAKKIQWHIHGFVLKKEYYIMMICIQFLHVAPFHNFFLKNQKENRFIK
jgi:hypothetical protein